MNFTGVVPSLKTPKSDPEKGGNSEKADFEKAIELTGKYIYYSLYCKQHVIKRYDLEVSCIVHILLHNTRLVQELEYANKIVIGTKDVLTFYE